MSKRENVSKIVPSRLHRSSKNACQFSTLKCRFIILTILGFATQETLKVFLPQDITQGQHFRLNSSFIRLTSVFESLEPFDTSLFLTPELGHRDTFQLLKLPIVANGNFNLRNLFHQLKASACQIFRSHRAIFCVSSSGRFPVPINLSND